MKRYILIAVAAVLSALSTGVAAQSEADMSVSRGGYGMVKTNITTAYDHSWGPVTDGFAARVSYEFLRKKHFTLTVNARFASVSTDFDADEISDGFNPDEIGLNGTHPFGSAGITSTFNTTLFGHHVAAVAMLNGEWSRGGFAGVSGILMAMYMLKADKDTRFGIGPLVMINSTSRIPAFPVFMYSHRFNSRWALNLYGTMFGAVFTPGKNDMLNFGGDIDVKAFYFRPHNESLPSRCRFTSTTFRPGVLYKRRIAENLYFDVSGGVALKMSSRVNGVSGTKRYFDCRRKASPYVQVGVSYSL